jgi:hypothetical protein
MERMMKNSLTILFLGWQLAIAAQSPWSVGASFGRNNTMIINLYPNTYFTQRATSSRWSGWGRYAWNDRWSAIAEVSREERGYKDWLSRLGDRLLVKSTFIDARYRFWMLTSLIEYRVGKDWSIGLGIAPMYQTSGSQTIRATGETWFDGSTDPSSMAGTFQCSGVAMVRYQYPICDQINIYGDARYNISWNRFEKARAGYHDAYGLNIGICYRL